MKGNPPILIALVGGPGAKFAVLLSCKKSKKKINGQKINKIGVINLKIQIYSKNRCVTDLFKERTEP